MARAPRTKDPGGGSELQIRTVPLADLREDDRNARHHGERNIAAIEQSLNEFDQVEPLVVQRGTGRVIGGNGRLVALRRLGRTHARIVEVDADDRRARALSIALNRTAELAEWDVVSLRAVIEEIEAEDGLLGAIGFEPAELDALARETPAADLSALATPDTAPKLDGLEHRVVVDARDEAHQRALIERFRAEGLKCRALIS